jgi:tetratricopeptide (TPR) repeat protein
LATKRVHLPTLEKLASIYRYKKQLEHLELTYRAILEECRKKNLKDKSLSILREMHKIFPMDEEYYTQFRKIKREMGITEDEAEAEEPPVVVDEAKEIIKETLDQADLYVEQGLMRNARRILENLRVKFPSESIIEQKINELNELSPKVKDEELPERVERAAQDEVQRLGKDIKSKLKVHRPLFEEGGEEKLTAADVFAETDIIPIVSQEEKEIKYYNLRDRVEEELSVIQAIRSQQLKQDTADLEKELSDIVKEFKKGIKEKIDKEDYESHFNLGIAYLEQDLIDEAAEEFKVACQDEKRAVDCYSILSYCYKKKKDYKQALEWLEKALDISKKGSGQYYGLKYELASLYEDMEERRKALDLYAEIKEWNPKYRDTTDRLENLGKNTSK